MAPTLTTAIPVFILPNDSEDGYNIGHFYLKNDFEIVISVQTDNLPAYVLEQN